MDGDRIRDRYEQLQDEIEMAKKEYRTDMRSMSRRYNEIHRRIENLEERLQDIMDEQRSFEATLYTYINMMTSRQRYSCPDAGITIRDGSIYRYNKTERVNIKQVIRHRGKLRAGMSDERREDFDQLMELLEQFLDDIPALKNSHMPARWHPVFTQGVRGVDLTEADYDMALVTTSGTTSISLYLVDAEEMYDMYEDWYNHSAPTSWKWSEHIQTDRSPGSNKAYMKHVAYTMDAETHITSALNDLEHDIRGFQHLQDLLQERVDELMAKYSIIQGLE